jgi:acyl-CoA reductase-like NAD-dependent aldehyde dehydrogenase
VLELSGNDPFIVRHDAPVALSVKAAVWGSMMNSGQNCVGAKRLLIHEKVYPDFKTLFLKELKKLVLGPPENWETQIGPLRREKELLRCEELIAEAVAAGATVLAGGKRAKQPTEGHFFEPTLLEGITPKMKLWSEDYFGPIALLDSFKTDDEALAKANSNPFGLGGAIFSKNKKRAQVMATQMECGMVTINEVIWPISLPMLPFGGVKASGFGRTRGMEGLHEMVYTKTIFAKSSRNRFRPHYFLPANKWTSKMVARCSLLVARFF